MSTEIARISIDEQIRYAQLVTDGSTILPDEYRNKPSNALVAIGLGAAMGLSPAESMYRIHVIKGKPTASAELIASNVRKAGHKIRVTVDEQAPSATCTIIRADDPDFPITVTRDMNWAKAMGLASKDNYRSQPATMLQWRAISACARLACSEALYGVNYTPDELTDLGESPRAQDNAVARINQAAVPAAPAEDTPVEGTVSQDIDWAAEVEAAGEDIDLLRAIWRRAAKIAPNEQWVFTMLTETFNAINQKYLNQPETPEEQEAAS